MGEMIALALVIVAPGLNLAAQSGQPEPEEWSLNVPSTPLQIGFSPSKRDMELLNRSSGHVNQYRLGCVRQAGEHTGVLRKFPSIKADLPSGKALINSVTLYEEKVQDCRRDKAKFAVIEVSFRDGSIWKLK